LQRESHCPPAHRPSPLPLQRPYSWSVKVNGVAVPMKIAANASDLPTIYDPVGTNLFNPQVRRGRIESSLQPARTAATPPPLPLPLPLSPLQLRTLWVTLRGSATPLDIVLTRTAAIQLNLHLAVSAESFFGADLVNDLSILLGISRSRIRIVDVRAGSVALTVEIADSEPTVVSDPNGNSTSAAQVAAAAVAQSNRLSALASAITALASSGGMSTIGGIPVTGLSLVPPPPVPGSVAAAQEASNPASDGGAPVVIPVVSATPSVSISDSATPTLSLTASNTATQSPSVSFTASRGASSSQTRSKSTSQSRTPSPSSSSSVLPAGGAAAGASASSSSDLSSGAIAGIAIGGVAVCGVLVAVILLARAGPGSKHGKVAPSPERAAGYEGRRRSSDGGATATGMPPAPATPPPPSFIADSTAPTPMPETTRRIGLGFTNSASKVSPAPMVPASP
jgi:hypothetical protein